MALKILLTQNSISRLGGSEIVSIEIMEYLVKAGHKVFLYCPYLNKSATLRINNLINSGLVYVDDIDDSRYGGEFDIVWVHHQLIPPQLINRLPESGAFFIFNHMSSALPLEAPFLYDIEEKISNIVLFNSDETQNAIVKKNPLLTEKSRVFPNPSPEEYCNFKPVKRINKNLSRILIVSNHPPTEVKKAIELLYDEGIRCDLVGGSAQTDVTPELISRYQAVITIGKTVQYSMVMGVPVYCYDHYGGPGYLNKNNIKRAAMLNFSGRGFSSKSPYEIKKQLINGFSDSVDFAHNYRDVAISKYSLSSHMSGIIDLFKEHVVQKATIHKRDSSRLNSWESAQRLLYHFLKHQFSYEAHVEALERKNNNLSSEITTLSKDLALTRELALKYKNLEKMKTYRLGRWLRSLVVRS